MFVAVINQSMD